MIKSYAASGLKVSREEAIEKAWDLVKAGCRVLSIEHGMIRLTEYDEDWIVQASYPGYVITVDTMGPRNRRLPEIRENLSAED